MSPTTAHTSRPRSLSAPPCAYHEEGANGHRIAMKGYEEFESGNQGTKTVGLEWKIILSENYEIEDQMKEIFVASPCPSVAGDLVKRAPLDVLSAMVYIDSLDLGRGSENENEYAETKNTECTDNHSTKAMIAAVDQKPVPAPAAAPNCDGDPSTCAMCALKHYYPRFVKHVICLQHVQTKKGCKHIEAGCQYCHPTAQEIGDNKDECALFKLTGFCRFRHVLPNQKTCKKDHTAQGPFKYLPPITHKLMSTELHDEVMELVRQFAQRFQM